MPGFLIFEELGIDPDMMGAGLAKTALAMVPGSWMLHGLGGEYNVDVDPIAEINATLDGGGHLGSMASSAEGAADAAGEGDVEGAVGGALGVVTEFWEAYKGWIPVVNIHQDIAGAAELDEQDMHDAIDAITDDDVGEAVASVVSSYDAAKRENADSLANPDVLRHQARSALRRRPKAVTGMGGEGVFKMNVEVHVDASFPKLLEAALASDGGKLFDAADVHMCTVASIDLRSLTFGSDNPAAQMIRALVGAYMFNVIPYLSISMRDVKITNVDFNLLGDAEGTIPSANITLKYKKVTWTYHVINNSNMNLYNVSFTYDVTTRTKPAEFSLGGLLNPFG